MKRRLQLLSALGLVCLLHTADGQEKKKADGFGVKVGEKMPFHVVDFFAGAKTKGEACSE